MPGKAVGSEAQRPGRLASLELLVRPGFYVSPFQCLACSLIMHGLSMPLQSLSAECTNYWPEGEGLWKATRPLQQLCQLNAAPWQTCCAAGAGPGRSCRQVECCGARSQPRLSGARAKPGRLLSTTFYCRMPVILDSALAWAHAHATMAPPRGSHMRSAMQRRGGQTLSEPTRLRQTCLIYSRCDDQGGLLAKGSALPQEASHAWPVPGTRSDRLLSDATSPFVAASSCFDALLAHTLNRLQHHHGGSLVCCPVHC